MLTLAMVFLRFGFRLHIPIHSNLLFHKKTGTRSGVVGTCVYLHILQKENSGALYTTNCPPGQMPGIPSCLLRLLESRHADWNFHENDP
jgi:hypothetical protein